MPSLSVRKLDEGTYERLKARAERKGVSMEEEVRSLIQRAVSAPDRLGSLALEFFGPENGIDLELPPREVHDPIDLGRR